MTRWRRRRRRRLLDLVANVGAMVGIATLSGALASGALIALAIFVDHRIDQAWNARMGALAGADPSDPDLRLPPGSSGGVVEPVPPAEERLGVDCPRCI